MSDERRQTRITLVETLERIPHFDDLEVLEAVKALFVIWKQPLDVVKLEQQKQLEASRDYLSKGGQRQLEEQHKREQKSRERETIDEALDIIRSWLRDILLVCLDKADEMVNSDFHFHIEQLAQRQNEASIARMLVAVDKAQGRIQYNVSKELVMETLFFALRDELAGNGLV